MTIAGKLVGSVALAAVLANGGVSAESISDISEIHPDTRVAKYLYSAGQIDEMYQVGVIWDRRLSLQQDCKSQHVVRPRTLALLQRIDFPDDSEHPVEGAWRHRFEFERCGETKIYNAIFVAKRGQKPAMSPYVPGETRASPILVRDAMMAALVTAIASLPTGTNVKGCKDMSLSDMTVTQEPQNPTDGVGRDPWKERWTFSVCGNSASSVITFVPDGRGGTSFSAAAK
jgi:hypothetical protein